MGLADTIKSTFPSGIKKKQLSPAHGGPLLTKSFPLVSVMHLPPFQQVVLGIISDLIHDCVEVYMDDFNVYGNTFEEALNNLGKVLRGVKKQISHLAMKNVICY
jgi:hypothetical protein